MTKYIFFRHGQIDANLENRYVGRSDHSLNTTGKGQVIAGSIKLVELAPSYIFSSPRPRAIQSTDIIAQNLGLSPIFIEELDELIMGPWTGLTENEVRVQYPREWEIWNLRPDMLCLSGRETLQMVHQRALIALRKIQELSYPDATVCIVSHVAIIRVMIMALTNQPLYNYRKINIPNAKPLIVEGGVFYD